MLSLAYGVLGAFEDSQLQGEAFWDLDYYRAAAGRWDAGQDPYLAEGRPTGYYYSITATPILARVFLGFEATGLYAVISTIGLLTALTLLVLAVRPPPGTVVLCWLYALAFGNADVIYAFASGNLAWLTGLLMAGALFAASRERWVPFYVLVGLASLIKPYALFLFAVPLSLGALSPLAVIGVLPIAVDALLAWAVWPTLVASRTQAVLLGVVEPLQMRYSITGRLSRALATQFGMEASTATLVALLVQLGVAAAIALVVYKRCPRPDRRCLALAAVGAFAAFPRMAGYDAYVFGPAVLIGFLSGEEDTPSRRAAVASAIVLVAGLLKEGLAVLPLVALVALVFMFPSLARSVTHSKRT